MKTTDEIANQLVELLIDQQFVKAYQDLFSDDAVSIDPLQKDEPTLKGLQNLIEREYKFLSVVKIQDIQISAPIVAGNYFTIKLTMRFNLMGKVQEIEELCVYKVANGKIISQQFFIAGI